METSEKEQVKHRNGEETYIPYKECKCQRWRKLEEKKKNAGDKKIKEITKMESIRRQESECIK
jgi:hypothetical protein